MSGACESSDCHEGRPTREELRRKGNITGLVMAGIIVCHIVGYEISMVAVLGIFGTVVVYERYFEGTEKGDAR